MSKLVHLNTLRDLGHNSLVWLARLRVSPMDFLEVTVELVLASESLLVVFTADSWTFEAFGVDTVLGRGVAHEVAEAFSDEFAIGLMTSVISRFAVMGTLLLMPPQSP